MAQNEKISVELLRKQIAEQDERLKTLSALHADGNAEDPNMSDKDNVGERLAKLEGSFGGVKHAQQMTLVAIGLLATFVIGFGIYELQKIDALNDKVNDLPGKISADLRDITKTLAEAILAAKQQPPQVILVPAPQPSYQTQPKPP